MREFVRFHEAAVLVDEHDAVLDERKITQPVAPCEYFAGNIAINDHAAVCSKLVIGGNELEKSCLPGCALALKNGEVP